MTPALTPALNRQRQVVLGVQGQPILHRKFQVSQGYMVRPCLKQQQQQQKRYYILNKFVFYFICVCAYASKILHIYSGAFVEVRPQLAGITFSLSSVWILGIELRLQCLVASSFTCWDILSSSVCLISSVNYIFFGNRVFLSQAWWHMLSSQY